MTPKRHFEIIWTLGRLFLALKNKNLIFFSLFFISALSDQQAIPPLPALSPPNSFLLSKTPFMSFNEKFLPKKRLTHLPPLINSHTAHKSLKKSVAVLTAFHGYDQSTGKFN